MAMLGASNSSPLALRKDHDSVENEKDFAKLNLKDLGGGGEEEDNTDSVPKVASLTKQEREGELYKLFERFKEFYQKEYDQKEDERRFRIFKEKLERPPTTSHSQFGINLPGFADLTQDELDVFQPCSQYYFYCSTSVSDLEELMAEDDRQSPVELTYY